MNTYTLVCINTYSSFYCWILPWDTTISMGLWKPCKHFSYFKSIISPPLLYMLSLSLLALSVHGAGYSKSLGTWLLHTAWEVFMEPDGCTHWFLEHHDCHNWEKSSLPARAVSQNYLEHHQSLAQQKRQFFLSLARRGKCSIKYLQRMGLDCRNICYQSYIPRGFHSQTASPLQCSCHTGLYKRFFFMLVHISICL